MSTESTALALRQMDPTEVGVFGDRVVLPDGKVYSASKDYRTGMQELDMHNVRILETIRDMGIRARRDAALQKVVRPKA